jgi:endonuclease/exonuclease/phosphatase family metal-dependent hydrolase
VTAVPTSIPVCSWDAFQDEFTVTTFNAALGPGLDVSHVHERIPVVAKAVAEANWDVLCLNEIWIDEAQTAVLTELGLPADHVLTVDTRGENEDPADRCEPGELDKGLACMRSKCAGLDDEETTLCAASKCATEGFALAYAHPHCFNCVVASAGKSANSIVQNCTQSSASRIYEGRNGVLLASHRPLTNVETILLPSSSANRVALLATVDVNGTPTEIACTHLTAARDLLLPTDKRFANWDEEMKAQLRMISDRLNARADGGPSMLIGDLNTGPVFNGDMQPNAPEVWKEVRNLGYADPASTTDPSICSRCSGNVAGPTDVRMLIDHVLTRGEGLPEPKCAAPAFDKLIHIVDSKGQPVITNMSDHNAITVQYKNPFKSP